MKKIRIAEAGLYSEQEVELYGWVYNTRSSGKIHFLQFRDGSGVMQLIADEGSLSAQQSNAIHKITIESSVRVIGLVKKEPRSPSGVELHVRDIELLHQAESYPIGKKEHGVDFLLDMRHLWIRSETQRAILTVRDEVIWALRSYFKQEHFVLTDSPILTPTSCEGTTELFETDYFGTPAYLSQSGQLYLEACAAALGRVYDFGPVFRAEKSKTRRHLTEFWMLDAEMAFADHEENLRIQEVCIQFVTKHVIETCEKELAVLERDTAKLQSLLQSFERMTYTDAVAELKKLGSDIAEGQDLGADDETKLMEAHTQPVFVTHYPLAIKAFYMKSDPTYPEFALCNDLLFPEGYGEIIGGSQRVDDADELIQRIKQHKLPQKEFEWYVDLRRYGSFPHAGFGIGLERLVTFYTGRHHLRESIPFARTLNRLRP